jgi:hypothetical protein
LTIASIILSNIGHLHNHLSANFHDSNTTQSASIIAFTDSINFGIKTNSQKIIELLKHISNENLKPFSYYYFYTHFNVKSVISSYSYIKSSIVNDIFLNQFSRKIIFPFHFFW